MRFPVICVPFLPAEGMALFPFILVKRPGYKNDKVLIHHETIHIVQQLELFVLPFYVLYLASYFLNRMTRSPDAAYRNIVFEKEAWAMQNDLKYLKSRPLWAWMKYM